MDDNNNKSSAISDQSSDQTEESADSNEPETTKQDETIESAKSESVEANSEVERTTEPNESSLEQGAKQTISEPRGETSGASRPDEPTEPAATDEPTSEVKPEPETNETKVVMDKSADQSTSTDKETPDLSKKNNPNAKWYVVHTYSGHENKVAHTLKQRVESEHLEEKILDVLVPTQDKIEIKGGKKVNVKEKIFPGYILVKMVLNDVSWLAVRTTQGVTSFVGMGNKPTPISEAEVATIVKFTQTEAPMYKQVFMSNDTVKIVDGPFADFIGKIDNVDEEKGKVKVLVSIFGRETPVELDFLQVQKL